MEDKKIIQVNWSQELHDELKKDIEKLNEDFNLEKLEQLIKDETEDDNEKRERSIDKLLYNQ